MSDNGKTFKAAARIISAIRQYEEIKRYLSGGGAEWVFNMEKTPL